MLRAALVAAIAAAICSLPAAAAPRVEMFYASWPDARHGWAPCGENRLCATDDGGRRWRQIFAGGNYVFTFVRTSAGGGVLQAGNWGGYSFWTRDGGRRWYELPVVPQPLYSRGDRALLFGGRGSNLFWHQSGRALNRIAPWPPARNPVCAQESWPGPRTCELDEANAPFRSQQVAALDAGWLSWMRSVPRGVAALVAADDPNGSPLAVLVHRNGQSTLSKLPEPPSPRRALTCTELHAAWPSVFVLATNWDQTRTNGRCPALERVLWRSDDGGATWRVERTSAVERRPGRAARGRTGTEVRVPGGWVAAIHGAPAIELRRLGRTRDLRLPPACGASAGTPIADWPALLVPGRTADGATPVRWWSSDGGATWDVFGECR